MQVWSFSATIILAENWFRVPLNQKQKLIRSVRSMSPDLISWSRTKLVRFYSRIKGCSAMLGWKLEDHHMGLIKLLKKFIYNNNYNSKISILILRWFLKQLWLGQKLQQKKGHREQEEKYRMWSIWLGISFIFHESKK